VADTELESMTVKLKGDATSYTRMLMDAQSAAHSTASALATTLGGAVSAVGGAVTGIVSSVSSSIGSILGTGVQAFGTFKRGLEDIEGMSNNAQRLAMSVGDLRAAMRWGGGASSMPVILSDVATKLAQVRTGSQLASQDFEALATASRSASKATDFRGVVDQLGKIQDPTNRASLAFRVLGDNAGDVLRQLSDAGRMGKSESLIKRFGLGASGGEIEQVRRAADSFRDLKLAADGVFNQAMIALAPFANALTKAVSFDKLDLSWIKGAIGEVVRGVGLMGAFFVEARRDMTLFWDALKVGVTFALAGIKQLQAGFLDMAGSIATALNPVAVMIEQLPKSAQPAAKVMAMVNPFGDIINGPAAGMGKAAEDARKESGKILDVATQLGAEFAKRLNRTDAGKAVNTWVNDVLEETKRLDVEMRRSSSSTPLPVLKAMGDQLKDFRADTRTAVDVFQEQMTRLRIMQGTGPDVPKTLQMGSLSKRGGSVTVDNPAFRPNQFAGLPGVAELAAFQAAQKLISAVGMPTTIPLASGAEAFSREARSAEIQYRMLGERESVQEQVKQAILIGNQQRDIQIQIGKDLLQSNNKFRELLFGDGAKS